MSLDEIAHLLRRKLSAAEMQRILRAKQQELRARVSEEQARLERVETRLQHLEQEKTMSNYDVRLKKVEPLLVASVRDTIPNWEEVTPTFNQLFDEVYPYAASQNAAFAGPALDLWHVDGPPSGEDMPVEAAFPLATPITESDRVKVYSLPAVATMATTIHHGAPTRRLSSNPLPHAGAASATIQQGAFATISQAHQAVIQWADDNGYQICGPGREIYLQYEREGDPNAYVTEIQYPVQKA